MKKLLVIIILITLSTVNHTTKAQFDYVGGGVVLAAGGEYNYAGLPYYNNSIGFDLRLSYNYNKKLKIVPDLKFYLPNKEVFLEGGESKVTVFVLNINAHYVLNPKTRNTYQTYLLAGVHFGAWKIKNSLVGVYDTLDINEFKFAPGANVGAGMIFAVGNRTKLFAEVKYLIATANQLAFTPGLIYNF
ncbi:MAG: hypothetical protein PF485_12955 [Bacteroidales bacterium]|jgi:hypothetical protein|nr:hypothetical protein [Bacteroidales bacterium]